MVIEIIFDKSHLIENQEFFLYNPHIVMGRKEHKKHRRDRDDNRGDCLPLGCWNDGSWGYIPSRYRYGGLLNYYYDWNGDAPIYGIPGYAYPWYYGSYTGGGAYGNSNYGGFGPLNAGFGGCVVGQQQFHCKNLNRCVN